MVVVGTDFGMIWQILDLGWGDFVCVISMGSSGESSISIEFRLLVCTETGDCSIR